MEQRRKFSKEFKLEAVNIVLGRGVSIAQVARDLASINHSRVKPTLNDQGQQFT
jgi:transposase